MLLRQFPSFIATDLKKRPKKMQYTGVLLCFARSAFLGQITHKRR